MCIRTMVPRRQHRLDGNPNYQARISCAVMAVVIRRFSSHSNTKPPAINRLMEVNRKPGLPNPVSSSHTLPYFDPSSSPERRLAGIAFRVALSAAASSTYEP